LNGGWGGDLEGAGKKKLNQEKGVFEGGENN